MGKFKSFIQKTLDEWAIMFGDNAYKRKYYFAKGVVLYREALVNRLEKERAKNTFSGDMREGYRKGIDSAIDMIDNLYINEFTEERENG